MDNVLEFPDRAAIEEEAAAWLIKLDGDTQITQREYKALQAWLDRSPAHCVVLKDLAVFWRKMNVLTELAVPLRSPEAPEGSDDVRDLGGFHIRFQAAWVAVIVLGLAVALGLWAITPVAEFNGLYATAIGQQKSATMIDGSVIQLNTNSQVEVDYGEHYRNVRLLQGEALFTVEKDPDRPFRVYAGHSLVQAVGTEFSVYLKDHSVDVMVTEGRIALADLNQYRYLASTKQLPGKVPVSAGDATSVHQGKDLGLLDAGQATTIRSVKKENNISESVKERVQNISERELAQRLSWRDGLLTFTGEPLTTVIEEVSRYTPLSITIAEPDVGAIKIGGQFKVGETEAMFEALRLNFGLRVTRLSNNEVQITAGS